MVNKNITAMGEFDWASNAAWICRLHFCQHQRWFLVFLLYSFWYACFPIRIFINERTTKLHLVGSDPCYNWAAGPAAIYLVKQLFVRVSLHKVRISDNPYDAGTVCYESFLSIISQQFLQNQNCQKPFEDNLALHMRYVFMLHQQLHVSLRTVLKCPMP